MAATRTPTVYPSGGEHDRGHDREQGLARVGVRELRQNLSVYLRRIEAGETLEVTDHGRPVARLTPLPAQRMGALDRLVSEGRAIPGTGGDLADLGPPPEIGPGPALSDVLAAMRDEDDR
jgi:prevent-host-death family protein